MAMDPATQALMDAASRDDSIGVSQILAQHPNVVNATENRLDRVCKVVSCAYIQALCVHLICGELLDNVSVSMHQWW